MGLAINKQYAADFETDTTHSASTFVWAWGVAPIKDKVSSDDLIYGSEIKTFVAYTLEHPGVYWFHNEKFDGSFIINFLLKNNFVLSYKDEKDLADFEFRVICNSMGQIYKITYNVSGKIVRIQNSVLKIPGTIRSIAKSLNMDIVKGEIDYYKFREEGAELSKEDLAYLENDVLILAKAMYEMHMKNKNYSMTIGADCLKRYKQSITGFDSKFPKLPEHIDRFIRKSYNGGFVHVNPLYKGIKINGGHTADKNSMYPGVMHSSSGYLFPYGEPVYFTGPYRANDKYPIFIQRVVVTAKLKPGRWPTINLAKFNKGVHAQYATELEEEELTLTDIDLLWLAKNYDLEGSFVNSDGIELSCKIEFLDGFMFRATTGMFDRYIDLYMELKAKATYEKDPVKRQLAKLMLNNLYGKFGTNPLRYSKVPVFDKKQNKLRWVRERDYWMYKPDGSGERLETVNLHKFEQYNPAGYIPVAVFCTAYARNELWSAMDAIGYDNITYTDTDSLHFIDKALDLAQANLEIHDTKLGAWALESKWKEGIFLRPKTYAELQYGELKIDRWGDKIFKAKLDGKELNWDIKCAGMPDNVKAELNIEDFKVGETWASMRFINSLSDKDREKFLADTKGHLHIIKESKLVPKQVDGGVILVETQYTIHE